ncbi:MULTISPECIES: MBL fold metallo-hydrolase [Melioribacter]|nr:MBL fold metallo-hydrolase [Melioribacter roseus]
MSGDSSRLSVTWLGHSTLLINLDGYRIMTDPVLAKRISLFGPSRYNGDAPVEIDQIPQLDIVVISHNHYDHLNRRTIEKLRDRVKRFVAPLGVGAQLIKWGVPAEKIVEMDWWDELTIDGLFVACTPSQHFSGRGLFDRDKTLWASFILKGASHKIYFSGDSGYFKGFERIGQKYGPFDITFLECGAYDSSWHHIHMFPEETIQAHLDLEGKVLHPIHWGTFNLALHDWYEPMERFLAEANRKGIQYATPIVGESTLYPNRLPQKNWWRLKEPEQIKYESNVGFQNKITISKSINSI